MIIKNFVFFKIIYQTSTNVCVCVCVSYRMNAPSFLMGNMIQYRRRYFYNMVVVQSTIIATTLHEQAV